MQPRRIARELALLSLSQLPQKSQKLEQTDFAGLLPAAIRTLATETRDSLENASSELVQANEQLLRSRLESPDQAAGKQSLEEERQQLASGRAMAEEAIRLTEVAINRLGAALDLPTFVQVAGEAAVQDQALALVQRVAAERESLDQQLNEVMQGWQLHRLPRIDQDILRLAVVEVRHFGLPEAIAINEAVELAKRYSDEEGRRLINGVLRRFADRLSGDAAAPQA